MGEFSHVNDFPLPQMSVSFSGTTYQRSRRVNPSDALDLTSSTSASTASTSASTASTPSSYTSSNNGFENAFLGYVATRSTANYQNGSRFPMATIADQRRTTTTTKKSIPAQNFYGEKFELNPFTMVLSISCKWPIILSNSLRQLQMLICVFDTWKMYFLAATRQRPCASTLSSTATTTTTTTTATTTMRRKSSSSSAADDSERKSKFANLVPEEISLSSSSELSSPGSNAVVG